MEKSTLIFRLELILNQLEELHESVVTSAVNQGINPSRLVNSNGELTLLPVFTAQAHALSALAYLQDK
ncbi:MAG: hypothetical protein ACJ74Y_14010 [Bryobacteraceae bacterium]|jgi:hypothetical protein